ncbi:signal recognition particle, SRP9/SRP14 subunit [Mollisia scopiformis]|uniref:Signal recognition particle subunit SRP14 n=1 Tax=Mollisia scopiformis TaxID=149040 RepID=A0A194WSM1_MOLSC|nr:signal recognition particle, SRP9/SRP14 subunit [Mollisia scopiformis]KUJ10612.1 signal recognition particle, SRP9/SRP14 subunit [Mollisia scopiformis]
MSKSHLSNDDFFLRLSELFDERRQKNHGSIHLTQKRMSYGADGDVESPEPSTAQPFPDLTPSKPLPIIIRATNGKSKEKRDKKVKLSTIVDVDALEGFYSKYAEVCKLGMSGLKKRDRSKAKEKLKAKKKKQGGAAAGGTEVKKEKP